MCYNDNTWFYSFFTAGYDPAMKIKPPAFLIYISAAGRTEGEVDTMKRAEFLDILHEQLSGKMHEGRIAAHLRYYEDYIQSRVRKGEEEEDIIESLGDPRLIAKTLLDTDVPGASDEDETDHYKSYADEYGVHEETSGHSDVRFSHFFQPASVPGKIAAVIVTILIISVVFRLLRLLLPFILILFLAWFVMGKIRR